jgi:predicted MFS family arabinose efflux permease
MNSSFGLAVLGVGLSPKVYGALLSFNGALVVFCELPLTTITRRFPPMQVIAFGYLFVGIGFGLGLFAQTIVGFASCIAVFTLGEMCAMPVTSALVAGLAPGHMRGRYMGTYGLTWTVAQVIGPGLGMGLFATSPSTFWLVGGGLGIASAFIAYRGRTSFVTATSSAAAPVSSS